MTTMTRLEEMAEVKAKIRQLRVEISDINKVVNNQARSGAQGCEFNGTWWYYSDLEKEKARKKQERYELQAWWEQQAAKRSAEKVDRHTRYPLIMDGLRAVSLLREVFLAACQLVDDDCDENWDELCRLVELGRGYSTPEGGDAADG